MIWFRENRHVADWCRWFAWRPVEVGLVPLHDTSLSLVKVVWLTTVERRYIEDGEYEYRALVCKHCRIADEPTVAKATGENA